MRIEVETEVEKRFVEKRIERAKTTTTTMMMMEEPLVAVSWWDVV
jgi:hypothetical protein